MTEFDDDAPSSSAVLPIIARRMTDAELAEAQDFILRVAPFVGSLRTVRHLCLLLGEVHYSREER